MSAEFIVLKSGNAAKSMASFFDVALAVIMILMVGGLFSLTDDHRFGFPFIRELTIVMSFAAILYLLFIKSYVFDRADWYVLVLTGLSFIIPVMFSYLKFAQPLPLGFLEERRSLQYLNYFLMIAFLGGRRYSDTDLEKVLRYCFYIGLIWAFANAFEIIPRNSGFSFSAHAEQFDADFVPGDSRYQTRFLGGPFLMIMYPFYLLSRGEFKKLLIPLVCLIVYMVFVNQTRTLAIGLSFGFLFMLAAKKDKVDLDLWAVFAIIILVFYFLYLFYVNIFGGLSVFYDYYRNVEFDILMGEARKHFFMPHGSLSVQFNNGFQSVYGFLIYPSDVGIVGLVFKYGFFLIPLTLIKIAIINVLFFKYRNYFSYMLMVFFVTACVISPFVDYLSRGTEEFALLMLLARLQGMGGKNITLMRRVREMPGERRVSSEMTYA